MSKVIIAVVLFATLFLAHAQEQKKNIVCKTEEDYSKEKMCQFAPVVTVVNPEHLTDINPERGDVVAVQVFAYPTLLPIRWTLAMDKHTPEQNETFFKKVTIEGDGFTLRIPEKTDLAVGEYTLEVHATRERKNDTLETVAVIPIALKIPRVKISMKVDPEKGQGLRTEFVFSFNWEGVGTDDEIAYAFSYVKGGNYITIDSQAAVKKDSLKSIRYHFPIPRHAKENVQVAFRYINLKDMDDETVGAEIEVVRPDNFKDDEIEDTLKRIERESTVDLKYLVAVANSLINVYFTDGSYHADMAQLFCDENFCNKHGQCEPIYFEWKGCKCEQGWNGPTCAFKGKDAETAFINHALKTLTIAEKVKLDPFNLGQLTEVIKAIAVHRHYYDVALNKKLLSLIQTVINEIGDRAVDKDLIEDVFISIENIDVAIAAAYFQKKEPGNQQLRDDTWALIKEGREKLPIMFDRMVKKMRDFDTFTHKMRKSSVAIKTVTPSKGGRKVEERLELGFEKSQEITLASIPYELLKTIKGGDKPLALVAYESSYSPYDVLTDDEFFPVSGIVSVKIKDYASQDDIKLGKMDTPITMFFNVARYRIEDLKQLECAYYNPFEISYETEDCRTGLSSEGWIECTCNRLGEFVLVIRNPDYGKDEEDEDSPLPTITCKYEEDYQEQKMCQYAPVITVINSDHLTDINPDRGADIGVQIFSYPTLLPVIWSLDPMVHTKEENKTFFSKVKVDTEGLAIQIPPESGLPVKNYTLEVRAIRERRTDRLKTIAVIPIALKIPRVNIKMRASPNSAQALRDTFTFNFEWKGEKDKIAYALSYLKGGNYITIESQSEVTEIKPVTYTFPIPRREKERITIALRYINLEDMDDEVVTTEIEVLRPANFNANELETHLSKLETSKDVDLNFLNTIAHSMMNVYFTDGSYNADVDQLSCTAEKYCNNNGDCDFVYFEWKVCKCKPGFAGPTCAFKDGSAEKQAIDLFKKILTIAERVEINPVNLGQLTEVIKSIAVHRHYYSDEIIRKMLGLLHKVVGKLDDRANEPDLVEDVFISIENIDIAVAAAYFSKNDTTTASLRDNTWKLIKEGRDQLPIIFDKIVHSMKSFDTFSHKMRKSSIVIKTTTPARSGKKVFESLELGLDKSSEITIAQVPYAPLMTVQSGIEALALIAYESSYSPYDVLADDAYFVISGVFSLKLKVKNTLKDAFVAKDAFKTNPISLYYNLAKYQIDNLKDVECGYYDQSKKGYFKEGCTTGLTGEGMIECKCNRLGDYVLVMKNPFPRRDGGRGNDQTPSDGNFKSSQVLLTLILVVGIWGTTYIAALREGLPNNQYSDNLTLHPLYSILAVYSGHVPRSVRVHLFFLTVVVQLVAETLLFSEGSNILFAALTGIAASIPANYIFGILASKITGGKPDSRGSFIFLAEVLLIAGIIFANMKMAVLTVESCMALIKIFIVGLTLDIVLIDTIVAVGLGKSSLQSIFALRGFYNRETGDSGTYLRQNEVAL